MFEAHIFSVAAWKLASKLSAIIFVTHAGVWQVSGQMCIDTLPVQRLAKKSFIFYTTPGWLCKQERFPAPHLNTCSFFSPPSYPSPSLLNQFVFRLINPPPATRCLQSTRQCWKFHPGSSKSCYFMPRNGRKTSLTSDRKDKSPRYPSSLAFHRYG